LPSRNKGGAIGSADHPETGDDPGAAAASALPKAAARKKRSRNFTRRERNATAGKARWDKFYPAERKAVATLLFGALHYWPPK
jgi:hypothetical protein